MQQSQQQQEEAAAAAAYDGPSSSDALAIVPAEPSAHDAVPSTAREKQLQRDLQERDEVVSKLASLLRSHGVQLPKEPDKLQDALQSLSLLLSPDTPDADRAKAAGQLEAGMAGGRRQSREGTAFWDDLSNDVSAFFQHVQSELPMSHSTEVRFKGLTYWVQRRAGAVENPTMGDMFLKLASLLTCFPLVNTLVRGGPAKPRTRTIVRNVSGAFRPGELTLVIGPPGCGKSSLLKLIAGQVHADKSHRISGQVLYNGEEAHTGRGARFSLPKVAAYIQQVDRHIAHLTVEETIQFAFDCMEGGAHGSWVPEGERTERQAALLEWMDKKNHRAQTIMKLFGLLNAKDTIVGDVFTRGVSGGERRRVTSCEMVAGGQDVFLMDSISNGLDSSTTFDILTTLKTAAHTFKKTVVVALLQPQPEVYALFDQVVVMADGGRIVYQGRREGVLPHFRSIGFECPPRKDEADFCVEVTTDQGIEYAAPGRAEAGAAGVALPHTPAQFEALWHASDTYKELQRELEQPAEAHTEWLPHQTRLYAGTWRYHLGVCARKHWTLFKRDTTFIITGMAIAAVMGLVMGSIYFDLPVDAVNSKFGILFFALLFLGLKGMAQIPAAMENRSVFYKQHEQGFYPASCDVIGQEMSQVTLMVAETAVFAPVLYFMVGLSTDAGRFFIFLATVLGFNLNMASYFRLLSAAMPNLTVAQAAATLCLVLIVIYNGYFVSEDNTPDVFIWIYWVNPITWAFRTLILNEFLAPDYKEACASPVAAGEACPVSLSTAVLDSYGFRSGSDWIWGGIVFVYILWLLTTFTTGIVLHKVRWDSSDNAPIADEAQLESAGVSAESSSSEEAEDEVEEKEDVTASTELGAKDSGAAAVPRARRRSSRGRSYSAEQTRRDVEADMARLKSDGTAASANMFTPVTLAFQDVSYSVPHPSGEGSLELLTGVSGYAKPGTMTALMGSSGAGKTTLLDVLASRKTGGEVTGTVTLNGYPKDKRSFSRVAGYVEQVDVHSPVVTVREAVMFSAALRLEEKDFPPDERAKLVDAILAILELSPISDRLIGSEATGGLSGEQRKRVTIAVELASNPSLIFLDEPTTGLDARSAQVVVRAIRKVATTGRTIVCTIHQPSTYLFEMFDSMLLLKRGGQVVYFGELGVHSSALTQHMSGVPGTTPIADNANPATWMLEQIGAGTSNNANPQVYADWYAHSQRKRAVDAELERLQTPGACGAAPLAFATTYAASAATQRRELVRRAYAQYWRSSSYNFARMFAAVVQALIFAATFVGVTPSDVGEVASVFGVIFQIVIFVAIVFFNSAIPFTSAERSVFYREQASRMYHVAPYALGYFLAEIPYLLFNSLLACSIFYFMANLEADAGKFFWFWFFFLLAMSLMTFFGHALTAAVPTAKDAQSLASISNALFAIFGGFFINPAQIPDYWIWAYWVTPFHYAIEGIITTQYHDNDMEVVALDGKSMTTVSQYMDDFFGGKFSYANRGYDVLALLIFVVIFQLMFVYALARIRHEKR